MMSINKQGSLDGLCGLYSVVNAVSHLGQRKVKTDILSEVFSTLSKVLDDEGKLADALVEGMKFRTLGKLLDAASDKLKDSCGLTLRRKVASRTRPVTLDGFWKATMGHVDEFGAGSCILGLGGRHSHWTCVKSVNASSLRLIDSDGLHVIQRSRSTVGTMKGSRHHELWPTQSYFLELVPAG